MKHGNIEFANTSVIRDASGSVGTSGQVLSSTGTATAWVNQSGGTGGSPVKCIESMSFGSASSYVPGFGASSTSWAFNGVQFTPQHDVTISTASTMTALLIQSTAGRFMFSIYQLVPGGNHTRVAYTASTTIPGAGYITPVAFSVVDVSTLTGGVTYIMGVWYGGNGPTFAGVPNTANYNIKPFCGMIVTNFGNLATAPATFADSITGESGRVYFRLTI